MTQIGQIDLYSLPACIVQIASAFQRHAIADLSGLSASSTVKGAGHRGVMKRINSYLTFNGNCRNAMSFYRDCLGGELVLQTIGESPLADQLPETMKRCILHSALTNEALVLLGSDMVSESGLVRG